MPVSIFCFGVRLTWTNIYNEDIPKVLSFEIELRIIFCCNMTMRLEVMGTRHFLTLKCR